MIGWKNSSNSPRIASTRIRCLEPMQELQRRKFPVELFQAKNGANYRAVVFNKVYDQAHLELAREVKKQGAKVVLDICDNHFYNPGGDAKIAERGQQLLRMMKVADVITVPGEELQRTLPLPSQIVRDGVRPLSSMEKWQRRLVKRFRRHQHNLVWFGNWGGHWGGERRVGGMSELLPHQELLVELAKTHDIGLTVISSKRKVFDELFADWEMPLYYENWGSDNRLRRSLARFDICLLPVSQDPYTLCKSNNRLALALYLGLTVVADEIPAYREFAPFSVLDGWENGLEDVLAGRLRPAVEAGQQFVENNYMTANAADDWQRLFEGLG